MIYEDTREEAPWFSCLFDFGRCTYSLLIDWADALFATIAKEHGLVLSPEDAQSLSAQFREGPVDLMGERTIRLVYCESERKRPRPQASAILVWIWKNDVFGAQGEIRFAFKKDDTPVFEVLHRCLGATFRLGISDFRKANRTGCTGLDIFLDEFD